MSFAISIGMELFDMAICEICGAEFTPKRPWAKYCSKKCNRVRKRREQAKYYEAHKNDPKFIARLRARDRRRQEAIEAVRTCDVTITDPVPTGFCPAEAWEFGLAVGMQ